MNKIEVNGLILYYSIEFDCSEYDEWEWTEFFLKTTKKPNNRIVYTVSIWADFYLDINVINSK